MFTESQRSKEMKHLNIFLMSIILFAGYSKTAFSQSPKWRTLPGAPTGARMDDVFFTSPSIGWVIASNCDWWSCSGKIWKTIDGGETWALQSESEGYPRSIGFADSLTGWLGLLSNYDSLGVLYHTIDGGENWSLVQNIPEPRPQGICGISVVNDSVVYASGRYNGPPRVIKTTDRGITWTSMDLSAYAGALVDCYFFSPDSGFVVGSSNADYHSGYALVLFTSDGGDTWSIQHYGSRLGELCWKIQFRTRTTGYVSIEKFSQGPTYYLKSTDGGITWSDQLFQNSAYDVQGIGFISDSMGWLGGWMGDTYETTDAGASWHLAGFGNIINRFRFLSDTLAYAVGSTVYKYSIDSVGGTVWVNENQIQIIQGKFFLSPNYPNPFNPSTTIEFLIPTAEFVTLKVYDVLGNEVATLVNEEKPTGSYEINFDASELSSGIYFYKLQTGLFVETRKMILLK